MPAYFPENNTTQWGDTAERSLQKISDLLKNGDVPIKINSVAVTGPFTVNNEVEITNDEGHPITVAGVDPTGARRALTTTSDSLLKTVAMQLQFVGAYTIPADAGPGSLSGEIPMSNYPIGTVFLATGNYNGSAADVLEVRTRATFLQEGVIGNAYTLYEATSKSSRTQVGGGGTGGYQGPILFRHPGAGISNAVFRVVSGGAGQKTIQIYAFSTLDFGTGYPHVASIGTLVDSNNNLQVSDSQLQTRVGGTADEAATSDTGSFSLISLFKRLLDRLTTGVIDKLPTLGQKDMAGSVPVVLASNQSTVNVAGTVAVSNAFATETTLATLNNKIPENLTVADNRLRVNTDLVLPASLGPKTMADSLSVVLADGHWDVTVRGSMTPVATVSGELTTGDSTLVLDTPIFGQRRRYLFIQNISSAAIYLNFGNPATPTSMRLDAGASLSFEGTFVPSNPIYLMRSGSSNQRYFLMHATSV